MSNNNSIDKQPWLKVEDWANLPSLGEVAAKAISNFSGGIQAPPVGPLAYGRDSIGNVLNVGDLVAPLSSARGLARVTKIKPHFHSHSNWLQRFGGRTDPLGAVELTSELYISLLSGKVFMATARLVHFGNYHYYEHHDLDDSSFELWEIDPTWKLGSFLGGYCEEMTTYNDNYETIPSPLAKEFAILKLYGSKITAKAIMPSEIGKFSSTSSHSGTYLSCEGALQSDEIELRQLSMSVPLVGSKRRLSSLE